MTSYRLDALAVTQSTKAHHRTWQTDTRNELTLHAFLRAVWTEKISYLLR